MSYCGRKSFFAFPTCVIFRVLTDLQVPEVVPDKFQFHRFDRVRRIIDLTPVHARPIDQLNSARSASSGWSFQKLLLRKLEAMQIVLTTCALACNLQRR